MENNNNNNNNNNIDNVNIYEENNGQSNIYPTLTQQDQTIPPTPSVPQPVFNVNDIPSPSAPLPDDELPKYDEIADSAPVIEEKRPLPVAQPPNPNPDNVVINVSDNTNSNTNSNQPYALNGNKLPRHSVKVLCPHCNQVVDTKISFENNSLTYGCCILLFCFTCLLWILPICLNTLKDCIHYCPKCNFEIGRNEP